MMNYRRLALVILNFTLGPLLFGNAGCPPKLASSPLCGLAEKRSYAMGAVIDFMILRVQQPDGSMKEIALTSRKPEIQTRLNKLLSTLGGNQMFCVTASAEPHPWAFGEIVEIEEISPSAPWMPSAGP